MDSDSSSGDTDSSSDFDENICEDVSNERDARWD